MKVIQPCKMWIILSILLVIRYIQTSECCECQQVKTSENSPRGGQILFLSLNFEISKKNFIQTNNALAFFPQYIYLQECANLDWTSLGNCNEPWNYNQKQRNNLTHLFSDSICNEIVTVHNYPTVTLTKPFVEGFLICIKYYT